MHFQCIVVESFISPFIRGGFAIGIGLGETAAEVVGGVSGLGAEYIAAGVACGITGARSCNHVFRKL